MRSICCIVQVDLSSSSSINRPTIMLNALNGEVMGLLTGHHNFGPYTKGNIHQPYKCARIDLPLWCFILRAFIPCCHKMNKCDTNATHFLRPLTMRKTHRRKRKKINETLLWAFLRQRISTMYLFVFWAVGSFFYRKNVTKMFCSFSIKSNERSLFHSTHIKI